ncbi:MAG: hypothetical protein QOC59_431 [Microbacteriaceae bacterium]|nr:hypothetical protein [Microbacteriaceae bacterium]
MVSLDNRTFVMESSTASRVDPDAPTRFVYREAAGVLWGEYRGDTVAEGRFVGVRTGDSLTVSFVHAPVTGGPAVTGTATSRIEHGPDKRLRLVEDFTVEGLPHVSVCVEVGSS